MFHTWREERNKCSPEQCPENLLKEPNAKLLNYWLSRFVVEVCHEDGAPYPPAMINNILSELYSFSKSSVPTKVICPNFMDRKEPRFRDLTGAIQVWYRELRTEGVGAIVKHAALVTPEEETQLWNSKALGVHSPLALVRAFFMWVRHFASEEVKSSGGLSGLSFDGFMSQTAIRMSKTVQKTILE